MKDDYSDAADDDYVRMIENNRRPVPPTALHMSRERNLRLGELNMLVNSSHESSRPALCSRTSDSDLYRTRCSILPRDTAEQLRNAPL